MNYLIFSLHIQHVLHIQLKRICPPSSDNARPFVHLEPATSPVPHDEVVYIMVGVRIPRLESEDRSVGCRVELDHGLHGERSVDEVRWLIVHVLYVYDDALVVSVWNIWIEDKITVNLVRKHTQGNF